MPKETEDEDYQRHYYHLEDGAEDGLPIDLNLDSRKGYTCGEYGHRGVRTFDEVEGGACPVGPGNSDQYPYYSKDRRPCHRLLEGVDDRFPGTLFFETGFLCIALAVLELTL